MQSPGVEEEGRGDDRDGRQTSRQRQDERAESDIAAGRSEERSVKESVANDANAEGQEGGLETLARGTSPGGNQDGHTPFEGGGTAEAEMALAQKAALLPGWLWGAWGNTANPPASGGGRGGGDGDTRWDPRQWPPSYVGNGTSPVSPPLAGIGSIHANAKGKTDWGKEAIDTQLGGLRQGIGTGYPGGRGRGGNKAGCVRGNRRGRGARSGELTRDTSQGESTGGRRAAFAERRSPTSLAVYDWGLELHKGGVREVFTATVDTVEMVKVWANGDVTINTGTVGRTPATKTILNLVLAVFKVEIAEDEAGCVDANEVVWRVVHSSGYEQPYAEKMNMSLFPNRDWPYTKTKLKRLPTKIFLPKPQRPPNQTRGMTRPTHGDTGCGEAGIGTNRGGADKDGDQEERQHDVLSERGFDGNVFRGRNPHSNSIYKSSNTDGDYHQLAATAALVAGAASFGPPQVPVVSPGGNPLCKSAAAFAAAATKEGVPAHVIHHLMMSGGAAGALSGQAPSNYAAAMAAIAAAAAAAATRADGNVDVGATVGAGERGGAAEHIARLDSGKERRESPGNVDDNVVFGRDRGTRRPGGERDGMEAADSFSSLYAPQLVPEGVATATRASAGSFNDLGTDAYGDPSSKSRHGSGATSFSQRIPWRSDSRGVGNSGLNHGAAPAAAGGWRWPTPSPEAWQPWQPDDGSTSPSPPRGAAKKRHLTPAIADIEDGGGWRRRTDGQWERRRDVAKEDQTRRDDHCGRDDAGYRSNGSQSRERARSEDSRQGRRRRSDSRDSREHVVVVARRRRDARSREHSDSRKRSDSRRQSYSREKGSPLSSPRVELSPFSRALVGGSSNRCAASPATAGGESFGRNATDVRDSAGGDIRAGRRADGPSNDRDDASVGRPENDNRTGIRDGGDASAGDDVCLRARSSGGGDDGGMGQRQASYDPDKYDPNAYDPGEVTVKRENSGVQRQDSKRSASSESLTMAGDPKRSRSPSGSLSHGSRYQEVGLGTRERFVGAGGGNDGNDANTPYDRGVGFGLPGAGGGTPQHPLLDPSDSGSTRNGRYGDEHIEAGSSMYIGDDGQQSVTSFAASAQTPAHDHVSNVLQSSMGRMGIMQGPGFHAAGVVLGSQTLAPGDGVGVYRGWETQGGGLGAAGGEGGALIRREEQPMWSQQQQSHNQPPLHEQDNLPSHDHHQQQHVQHPTVYLPHGQQDGGGYAAEPVLTPPPPPPRACVWISGGGPGGRRA